MSTLRRELYNHLKEKLQEISDSKKDLGFGASESDALTNNFYFQRIFSVPKSKTSPDLTFKKLCYFNEERKKVLIQRGRELRKFIKRIYFRKLKNAFHGSLVFKKSKEYALRNKKNIPLSLSNDMILDRQTYIHDVLINYKKKRYLKKWHFQMIQSLIRDKLSKTVYSDLADPFSPLENVNTYVSADKLLINASTQSNIEVESKSTQTRQRSLSFHYNLSLITIEVDKKAPVSGSFASLIWPPCDNDLTNVIDLDKITGDHSEVRSTNNNVDKNREEKSNRITIARKDVELLPGEIPVEESLYNKDGSPILPRRYSSRSLRSHKKRSHSYSEARRRHRYTIYYSDDYYQDDSYSSDYLDKRYRTRRRYSDSHRERYERKHKRNGPNCIESDGYNANHVKKDDDSNLMKEKSRDRVRRKHQEATEVGKKLQESFLLTNMSLLPKQASHIISHHPSYDSKQKNVPELAHTTDNSYSDDTNEVQSDEEIKIDDTQLQTALQSMEDDSLNSLKKKRTPIEIKKLKASVTLDDLPIPVNPVNTDIFNGSIPKPDYSALKALDEPLNNIDTMNGNDSYSFDDIDKNLEKYTQNDNIILSPSPDRTESQEIRPVITLADDDIDFSPLRFDDIHEVSVKNDDEVKKSQDVTIFPLITDFKHIPIVNPPRDDSENRTFIRKFFTSDQFNCIKEAKENGQSYQPVTIPEGVQRPFGLDPDSCDLILDLINELLLEDISIYYYESFLDYVEKLLNTEPFDKPNKFLLEIDDKTDKLCNEEELKIIFAIADTIFEENRILALSLI